MFQKRMIAPYTPFIITLIPSLILHSPLHSSLAFALASFNMLSCILSLRLFHVHRIVAMRYVWPRGRARILAKKNTQKVESGKPEKKEVLKVKKVKHPLRLRNESLVARPLWNALRVHAKHTYKSIPGYHERDGGK